MARSQRTRAQQGQATVELAILLPLVALFAAAILQVALLGRDQVRLTHATAAAARAVMVEPSRGAATEAMERSGLILGGRDVTVTGALHSGGMATVVGRARPTRVPLVGLALSATVLTERLTVRVE